MSKNNKKNYSLNLKGIICTYTDYRFGDIKIANKLPSTCCGGIDLKESNNLVVISNGFHSIEVFGFFCPRCHKIFIKNKTINRRINSKNEYLLYAPLKTVEVGYKKNGHTELLNPIKFGDCKSYREEYNKNVKMYLVMRAFIDGLNLSKVISLMEEYGYGINKLNILPVNEQMNKDLLEYYKKASIDELCFISVTEMVSKVHFLMLNNNPNTVYISNDDEGSKIYFEFLISQNMILELAVTCSVVHGSKGKYRLKINNNTIKVKFQSNELLTSYTYPMKNDVEGVNILIKKEKFQKLRDNVENGMSNDSEDIDNQNVRLLKVADFLVRSTNYSCINNNHKIIRINAAVKVKTQNGLYEIRIPAAYCSKCNRYYILERYYEKLKTYGYICCKVDKFEVLQKNIGNQFSTFQDKSILSLYGYNVNQQDNLSESERHSILDFIIDNGVQTRKQVINHLEQNISLRKNNNIMKNAIREWEKDIEYLRKRQKVAGIVKVDSILVPVKRIEIK